LKKEEEGSQATNAVPKEHRNGSMPTVSSARNATKPKWVKTETEGTYSKDCHGNNQLRNPLGYLKIYL
jgi:hypothetical protein